MKRTIILTSLAMLTLAGCATTPPVGKPAEVAGALADTSVAHRSPTGILTVDGRAVEGKVVAIQSGVRTVRFLALPIPGHRGGEVRSLELSVKPCTRYYINAQRKTAEAMDWEPVIGKEEPMAGCN